jgi:hypothetical protein
MQDAMLSERWRDEVLSSKRYDDPLLPWRVQRCPWSYHVTHPPQLWIKLHRNQPNLLFTRPSIHLTGHVEVVENNPEIAPKRGVEISSECWDACMIEMQLHRGVENSKNRFFFLRHLTSLVLVITRFLTKLWISIWAVCTVHLLFDQVFDVH